jgi:hypothetical protein
MVIDNGLRRGAGGNKINDLQVRRNGGVAHNRPSSQHSAATIPGALNSRSQLIKKNGRWRVVQCSIKIEKGHREGMLCSDAGEGPLDRIDALVGG